MSRSRRRTPITGVTTAPSEKDDKRAYNRRYRHAVRQVLVSDPETEVVPHLYEYSDTWDMAKDGKMLFNPLTSHRLLRK